jgi:hypothetical protein
MLYPTPAPAFQTFLFFVYIYLSAAIPANHISPPFHFETFRVCGLLNKRMISLIFIFKIRVQVSCCF